MSEPKRRGPKKKAAQYRLDPARLITGPRNPGETAREALEREYAAGWGPDLEDREASPEERIIYALQEVMRYLVGNVPAEDSLELVWVSDCLDCAQWCIEQRIIHRDWKKTDDQRKHWYTVQHPAKASVATMLAPNKRD